MNNEYPQILCFFIQEIFNFGYITQQKQLNIQHECVNFPFCFLFDGVEVCFVYVCSVHCTVVYSKENIFPSNTDPRGIFKSSKKFQRGNLICLPFFFLTNKKKYLKYWWTIILFTFFSFIN